MSTQPDTSAIILAAGNGTRMKSHEPKQFMKLSGKRVVNYSIESLLPEVKRLIVTIPSIDDSQNLPQDEKIIYTQGGATRTQSIMNALKYVETPHVLIHDAARPFVTKDIIQSITSNLTKFACVYPVMPVVNSIVIDYRGELVDTPDRSIWREVQTPQGFRTSILKEALESKGNEHSHIPEIIRRMGQRVKHVNGSPWLFKITYAPSIYAAEHYTEEQGR